VSKGETAATEPGTDGDHDALDEFPDRIGQLGREITSLLTEAVESATRDKAAAEEEAKALLADAAEQARTRLAEAEEEKQALLSEAKAQLATATDVLRRASERDHAVRSEADAYAEQVRGEVTALHAEAMVNRDLSVAILATATSLLADVHREVSIELDRAAARVSTLSAIQTALAKTMEAHQQLDTIRAAPSELVAAQQDAEADQEAAHDDALIDLTEGASSPDSENRPWAPEHRADDDQPMDKIDSALRAAVSRAVAQTTGDQRSNN